MLSESPAPSSPTGGAEEISHESIHAQLARVLESPPFINSAQVCRFLRYLVERTLEGDTGAVKENLLGDAVFDRGMRFDPRTDPVVRVEARRLRAKLEEYYTRHGAGDSLVIRIPKGGYVPVFERRDAVTAAPEVEIP